MYGFKELDPDYLDAPKISAIGITEIQGEPVVVLMRTQGELFISQYFINPRKSSTAMAEVKELLKKLSKLVGV